MHRFTTSPFNVKFPDATKTSRVAELDCFLAAAGLIHPVPKTATNNTAVEKMRRKKANILFYSLPLTYHVMANTSLYCCNLTQSFFIP
jgi:hypothetical protein